ncbi:MAG: response regulator [Blastocatellia bacterium]
MSKTGKPITILVVDDDPDDRLLIQEALTESRLANSLFFAEDGEQALDFLRGCGAYVPGGQEAPRPGLILLDLNMPRKDGREVLREMRADPQLRTLPVVVLTTSKAEEDIYRTYELGVNSFITKPVMFESFVEVVRTLGQYWFEVVELPDQEVRGKYGSCNHKNSAG